jgi:hypothetical protein
VQEVRDLDCVKCGVTFENYDHLRDHCWAVHGEAICLMLKHLPINYQDAVFQQSFDLGVTVLNVVIGGQIWHGSICCGICKIGFDNPGELFVHLFHRHTTLCAVRAEGIERWPVRVGRLVPELTDILKRMTATVAIRCLVENSVYTDRTCAECGVVLADDDAAWEHAVQRHLIIVF